MKANSIPLPASLAAVNQPQQGETLLMLITAVFVALMIAFGWVGYVGGDDAIYSQTAIKFLQEGPYVGESHFEVRFTVILSILISYALFGIGVLQLALVSALYAVGTLFLIFLILKPYSIRIACLAVALLSALPLLSIQASITYCDMVEVFFVTLSIFLFIKSVNSPNQIKWLIFAGVAAALAYLSRTTSIALLAGYGVLFLMGQGPKRAHYWWMAGGFFLVILIDALFLFSETGDPVYRLTLAWANVAGEDSSVTETVGFMVPDHAGNISLMPLLDPILLFFINHEFGIFFFFAFPAILWALFLREKDKGGTALLRWLAIFGLVWAVVATIALSKYSHPRYYLVTCACFVIPLVVWLQEVVIVKSKLAAGAIILLLFAASFTGTYIDNKKPISGSYALRDYAMTTSEPIYTDPYTADRAKFLLEIENVDKHVFDSKVPDGSLYFYNPGRLEKIDFADTTEYEPKENWQLVYESKPSRKWSGIVLESLGLSKFIPSAIYKRLDTPWQTVEVYRVSN